MRSEIPSNAFEVIGYMEGHILFPRQIRHVLLLIIFLVETEIFPGVILRVAKIQRAFITSPKLPNPIFPL
jgi:hypothetical protein